jgi:hypothetical protein
VLSDCTICSRKLTQALDLRTYRAAGAYGDLCTTTTLDNDIGHVFPTTLSEQAALEFGPFDDEQIASDLLPWIRTYASMISDLGRMTE